MSKSERISHGLALLSIIVSIALAYAGSYEKTDSGKGEAQKKSLVYRTSTAYSPPESIAAGMASDVSVDLTYKKKSLRRGFIFTSSLTNDGTAPIKPDEVYEPVTISARAGWKLLDVRSVGPLTVQWTRTETGTFSAKPFLLNPNDTIRVTIVAEKESGPDSEDSATYDDTLEKYRRLAMLSETDQDADNITVTVNYDPVLWTARIADLTSIERYSRTSKSVEQTGLSDPFGISVNLYGWALPFLIINFGIYLFYYATCILSVPVLVTRPGRAAMCLIGAAVLSLSAAEAGATLFLRVAGEMVSAPLRMNLPPIVINFMLMVALHFYTRRRTPSPEAVAAS